MCKPSSFNASTNRYRLKNGSLLKAFESSELALTCTKTQAKHFQMPRRLPRQLPGACAETCTIRLCPITDQGC